VSARQTKRLVIWGALILVAYLIAPGWVALTLLIVAICSSLGIENPWKWYRENSMRGARKAAGREEAEQPK
jgi:hypothetical protein